MPSIKDIVSMGFGSFSDVHKIPTLGYSLGANVDNTGDIRSLSDTTAVSPNMGPQTLGITLVRTGDGGQMQELSNNDNQVQSGINGPSADVDPNNITGKYTGKWAYRKYYRRNRTP